MKLHVMVTYDKKAQAYQQPFFVTVPAIGTRSFANAVNQSGHVMNVNPEDFTLFLLGTFDDETGFFQLTANPIPVVEAINCKKAS